MSEQTTAETGQDALALGTDPAAQMAQILDFLAPGSSGPSSPAEPEEGAAAPAEPGQQPAADQGAAAPAGEPAAPAAGDGAGGDVPDDGAAAEPAPVAEPGGDAAGAVDASELSATWGEMSESFERRQTEQLQRAALQDVRTEHAEYFKRLEMHPLELVGEEVPALRGGGKMVLRDSKDAKDWQDAIKHVLVREIEDRASQQGEELRQVFETVHSSIDLFRNNADLIPRTKQFDKELAEQFVRLAKPYELRSNGKLIGYSVPVQPLVNQLRSQLAEQRAAKPAPAAPAPNPQRVAQAAEQPRSATGQFEAPQAGVTSKAGQSSSGSNIGDELMSAFFRQNGFTL